MNDKQQILMKVVAHIEDIEIAIEKISSIWNNANGLSKVLESKYPPSVNKSFDELGQEFTDWADSISEYVAFEGFERQGYYAINSVNQLDIQMNSLGTQIKVKDGHTLSDWLDIYLSADNFGRYFKYGELRVFLKDCVKMR